MVEKIVESELPAAEDRDERIRKMAYATWEEEGCPDGCADEHWHKAVAIVMAEIAVEEAQEPQWLQREAETVKDDAKVQRLDQAHGKHLSHHRHKRAVGA